MRCLLFIPFFALALLALLARGQSNSPHVSSLFGAEVVVDVATGPRVAPRLGCSNFFSTSSMLFKKKMCFFSTCAPLALALALALFVKITQPTSSCMPFQSLRQPPQLAEADSSRCCQNTRGLKNSLRWGCRSGNKKHRQGKGSLSVHVWMNDVDELSSDGCRPTSCTLDNGTLK